MEEILKTLSEVKVADLERAGKDYSFSDVQPLITIIFEKIETLNENPDFLVQLPVTRKAVIESFFSQFLQLVKQIQTFDLLQENPHHTRDDIANQIRSCHEQLFENAFLYLDIFILVKKNSKSDLDKLTKQAKEVVSEIEDQKKNADQITNAIREVSAEIGVSKFADVFNNQAEQNKTTAKKWLYVSMGLTAVIIFLLWITFNQLTSVLKDDTDFQISLQIFLTKALIFSFASIVFYQAVKNYNANMHLHALNKHRRNSLVSFQAFVESTKDPKIRDTVLIQATKAIFEAGETGYISSKNTSSIGALETIKIAEQTKE